MSLRTAQLQKEGQHKMKQIHREGQRFLKKRERESW